MVTEDPAAEAKRQISLLLPLSVLARLDAGCAATGRSRPEMIAWLIGRIVLPDEPVANPTPPKPGRKPADRDSVEPRFKKS